MAAESNIGARITIIGKAVALATMKELTAANQAYTDSVLTGQEEQKAGYATLAEAQTAYRAKLAETSAAQVAAGRKTATSMGKGVALSMAAIIGVVTYEGIKNATVLQKNLTLLHTQAGMTVSAMNQVAAAAQKIGPGLGATPQAYAQAAYAPASTGMGPAETIAIVNNAQKESIISGSNLIDTTNSLTGVMKSYNLGAGQAAKTQAQLNAIVGAGNMHFQDFNEAMKSGVAATSALYGVSLPSLGAPLAYMTDRGVPAAQAGTRLRMTMALMASPTAMASKVGSAAGVAASASDYSSQQSGMTQALKLAGVNQLKLASDMRQPDGILVALKDLKTHMDAAGVSADMQNAALAKMFGGGRSGSVAAALFANIPGGEAKYRQIMKGSTTQTFNNDYGNAADTQAAKLHVLDATYNSLSDTIGKTFLPVLKTVETGMSDTFHWFGENQAALITLGGAISLVAGAFGFMYLVNKIHAAAAAIRGLMAFYKDFGRSILTKFHLMGEDTTATDLNTAAIGGQTAALGTEDGALALTAKGEFADAGAARTMAGAMGAAGIAAGLLLPALVALELGHLAGQPGNIVSNAANNAGRHLANTLHLPNPTYGPDGYAEGSPLSKYNANGTPKVKPPTPKQQSKGTSVQPLSDQWFKDGLNRLNLDQRIPHIAATAWDDIFGGGSKPTTSSMPETSQAGPGGITPIIIHSTLTVDGKVLATAVQTATKKQAARN